MLFRSVSQSRYRCLSINRKSKNLKQTKKNCAVLIDKPFAEDFTSLKWIYTEYHDDETTKFSVGKITAYVQDCNGDFSYWHVKRGKMIIAKNEDHDFDPPHFFKCLANAENALRDEVVQRKTEILSTMPN